MSGGTPPAFYVASSSPTSAGTLTSSRFRHNTALEPPRGSDPSQTSVLVEDEVSFQKSTASHRIRSLNRQLVRVARSAFSFFRLAWLWLLLSLFLLLSSFFVAHRRLTDTSAIQSWPIQLYRQEAEASKYVQVKPAMGLTHLPELITTPRVGCEDPMLPAAMVMTKADDFTDREAWRRRVEQRSHGRLKPVFPLGLPTTDDKETIARGLAKEVAEHGDLLIGNFADVYTEFSTKTIMALNWFKSRCDLPTYLIKIDDDVVVNWSAVLEHIQEWTKRYQQREAINRTRLWDLPANRAAIKEHWTWAPDLNYDMVEIPWWVGFVWDGMEVEHNPSHPNVMPDFADLDNYPPYTSGPFYILHKEACAFMVDKRQTVNKHYAGNEDGMLGLLANGTYLRPLNAFEIIPFNDPDVVGGCGPHIHNVIECPCHRWWSIQVFDEQVEVKKYLDRCFDEEDPALLRINQI